MTPSVVDISEKLARITKHWTPGVVAELNGQQPVRLGIRAFNLDPGFARSRTCSQTGC